MHTASLIWITPDAEALVGKIARVSNPNNEDNPEVDKLIRYLIKHRHWSPFEMASMCVEIHTTRAIAAQVLRHRSFSFQEFSQRYAIPTDTFATVLPDLRRQDTKNRQNSTDDLDEFLVQDFQLEMTKLFDSSMKLYNRMLESGVAKECARFVLPLATPTRLYMTGSCRSWIHYINLRSAHGTQREHMDVVERARTIFAEQFPAVSEALGWV